MNFVVKIVWFAFYILYLQQCGTLANRQMLLLNSWTQIRSEHSFVLLKRLYDSNLIDVIRKRVLEDGVPYMGSSAGSNVATYSIQTTNDMPIVFPGSFDGMNLVPFNINPHYVDTNVSHIGAETRDDRIREFTMLNDKPVLALRGNSMVMVDGDKATLHGSDSGRLFTRDAEPQDLEPGSDLSFLLK